MPQLETKPTSNAIIRYKKKLLLLLRDNIPTIPNPNKWSLVGGVIENDETFRQAMRREMKEEINIIAKSIKYLGKLKTPDGNSHFIFLVDMTKDEVKNIRLGNEGQKVKFFSISEINKLELAKNLKMYFNSYGDYLEKWLNGNTPIAPEKLGFS
jgi:8-oxo-dGTP diphosphatase